LLSATDAALKLRRYWTVPVEDEIRYRRESDYVDQFRELLGRAVHDRLRVPRATVLMSGGLDSSSVAAFAATAAPSGQDRLKAFTLFHRKLIPDREPHFAGLVAQALRIPIQYLEVDRYNLFDGWEDGTYCPAEPHPDPLNALLLDFLTQALTFSRIVLTGQGGDPALGSSVSHYAFLLLRERRLGRLFHDFGHFLLSEGRASRLYLATRWRVLRDRHQKPPDPPQWLNAEFSSRFPYSERYGRVFEGAASPHRLRPYAHRGLSSPVWPDQFALYDPDATGVPVQFAHPYFDIRLIRALLRFPPVPWCTDKEIVRVALRGMLPDSVRLRRKSPLVEDVISILLRSRGHWWQHLPAAPGTERYLRWDRLPCPNQVGADEAWPFVRAVGLNLWMMAQNGSHPSSRPDGLTLAPGPPLPP
jgi:asparagine synthase (glutamine-hydrolysing)